MGGGGGTGEARDVGGGGGRPRLRDSTPRFPASSLQILQ